MNKHITITTNHIEFEQIIINSDLNILDDIQAENLSKEETKSYIIFGRDDMSQAKPQNPKTPGGGRKIEINLILK